MTKPPAPDLLAAVEALAIPRLPAPLELAGDCMVCADAHNPFTDYELAERVAKVAKKERIKRLIFAGDWWDYGRYSVYANTVPPASWQTERAAGKLLAQRWGQTFDEIIFLMGNHDRRKVKLLAGEEDDSDVFGPLASVAHIRSSNLGWCIIHSGGEVWRITHPKNYSRNPLVVANALALKYNCNVMTAHEHHLGLTIASDGAHVLVNLGCLANEESFAYCYLDDNTAPRMKKGFAMLRDGRATLFGEKLTDWSKYER